MAQITSIRVSKPTQQRVNQFKYRKGFRNAEEAIVYLLDKVKERESESEDSPR